MIDLSNQTIVIAGGMDATAAGIARCVSVAGASVVALTDDAAQGHAILTEAGGRVVVARPDVATALRDSVGDFHTLILNPAWYGTGNFIDTPGADWQTALDANFEEAVFTAQAAARLMIEREIPGSIVFVSHVSSLMPFLQTSVVGTTLAMLRPIVKMAAVDCGQYGIRVNIVAAGWLRTDWTQRYLDENGTTYIKEGIPLGRVGDVESVGDACCLLASDAARYVTGGVLTVDGGYTLTRSDGNSPYPSA